MISPRIFLKLILLALVVSGIGGYAYYKSQNLLEGPVIFVENPNNGIIEGSAVTNIEGVAQNVSRISLNDRNITIDSEGRFQEKVILWPGYNVIKISATDRFNREKKEILEIVYKETERRVSAESSEISAQDTRDKTQDANKIQ